MIIFLDWTQRFVVVMLMKITAFRAVVFTLNGWYRLSSHPAIQPSPRVSATLRAVSNRVGRSLCRRRLTTVKAGSATGGMEKAAHKCSSILLLCPVFVFNKITKCVVLKKFNKRILLCLNGHLDLPAPVFSNCLSDIGQNRFIIFAENAFVLLLK